MGADQSRQLPLRSCVLLPGRSTVPSVSTTSCAQRAGSMYVEPFQTEYALPALRRQCAQAQREPGSVPHIAPRRGDARARPRACPRSRQRSRHRRELPGLWRHSPGMGGVVCWSSSYRQCVPCPECSLCARPLARALSRLADEWPAAQSRVPRRGTLRVWIGTQHFSSGNPSGMRCEHNGRS